MPGDHLPTSPGPGILREDQGGQMSGHDKIVLRIARNYLQAGKLRIQIGSRVVARQKIATKLREEFPCREISVGGQVDIET